MVRKDLLELNPLAPPPQRRFVLVKNISNDLVFHIEKGIRCEILASTVASSRGFGGPQP